jgi:hypothetical protein
MRRLVAVLAVAAAAVPAASSLAAGGDTRAQATGPLHGDVDYAGTLKQGDDQDWYFFYVPAAGGHLHWTVTNTTPKSQCVPPGVNGCHIYATLVDDNGKQVGGENSAAGISGANPGEMQDIDWTFDAPGRYYLAFNEDGDGGSYSFKVTPASGLADSLPSGTGTQPSTPLRIGATPLARGVRVRVTVAAAGSTVRAKLSRAGRTAGSRTLHNAGARKHVFTVALTRSTLATLRRRHRLALKLAVTVTAPSGAVQRASRTVNLRG